MPFTVSVQPGKTFADNEDLTYASLNLLGLPTITLSGSISADDIPSSSVSTVKLADGAVTSPKIADRAINLDKIQEGDPGTLLYWDAGGVPQRLSPGNVDDKLTLQNVDGAVQPRWVAASEISDVALTQIQAGSANQHLITNGSGQVAWADDTGEVTSASDVSANTLDAYTNPTVAYSFSHSLSETPSIVNVRLICTDTDLGYAVNDELDIAAFQFQLPSGITRNLAAVAVNDTTVEVLIDFSADDTNIRAVNKAGTAFSVIDTTKWKIKVYAAKVS